MTCSSEHWRRFGLVLALSSTLMTALRGADKTKPLAPELRAAIRDGNLERLRTIVANGADVHGVDPDGNTPLILAAFYANADCVEWLLKKGADPNGTNQFGTTALHRAATDFEKTRLLLDAGAKVRLAAGTVRPDWLGNTPLLLAVRKAGNSKTVALLIKHGANVKERNGFGISPIMAAAASGDTEIVTLLLAQGADADDFPKPRNADDTGGSAGMRTPLMWAAYHNNLPLMRLLLKHGANPNHVTYSGGPLAHAAWHDSFAAAELLLASGAKVNVKDAMGSFAPLHWAASTDSPRADLVRLLLANRADPNIRGGEEIDAFVGVPQTPRLLAEKRGQTEIVEALVAAGAKTPPRSRPVRVQKRALPDQISNEMLKIAVENALARLQESAQQSRTTFLQHGSKQDCVSCHQQFLPMAAVGHARGRGVALSVAAAQEQIDLIGKIKHFFWHPEFITQAVFHPDPALTFGYELFGLLAENAAPSYLTDVRVHHLVTIQAADGRWFANLPRPPIAASDVAPTALALKVIRHYGWPGQKETLAASIARGRKWLWAVQAATTEEAAFQLLGLHWAGETADKLQGLATKLKALQRDDGGWAQLPKLDSDAYATGQSLYALAQAVKLPVTDPVWQKGQRYLLQSQWDDGSWHVLRRAFPVQPTMNSGFPHHRDGWISAMGTSWAVLALCHALKPGAVLDRPLVQKAVPNEVVAIKSDAIDFVRQVKPMLERSCVACHSGAKPRSAYRMETRSDFLKGGETGTAVVPGNPAQSALLDYVSDRIPEFEMPPIHERKKYLPLSKEERLHLHTWIGQGARWPADVRLTMPSRGSEK